MRRVHGALIHETRVIHESAGSAAECLLCSGWGFLASHAMTDVADERVDRFVDADARLDTVRRGADGVCRVCGEPTVRNARLCRHCRVHRAIPGTADSVVPLVYAVGGEPSGRLVRDYKDHPLRAVRQRSAGVLAAVTAAGLTHTACLEAVVGLPVTVRTTVPSLTFRAGVHPFARLLTDAGVVVDDVLHPAPEATCHRAVSPDKFEVPDPAAVAGRHVLVLDDVWTTGSNAQSAALVLRRAGAGAVSVVVATRWINPDYRPTARFLTRREHTGFDPRVCPVTGARCR